MTVRDIMTSPPVTIEPDVTLPRAIGLMKRHHIRGLPVVEDNQLVGIVTDRDLREASPSRATSLSVWELTYLLSETRVKDFMQRDVMTIAPEAPVEHAAQAMRFRKIGRLPVVEDHTLVGIVTESDIFRCFAILLGAERGFMQVTVPCQEGARPIMAALLEIPQLRTVSFGTSKAEARLVFAVPRGMTEAQTILRAVRKHVVVSSWHLSEASEWDTPASTLPTAQSPAPQGDVASE